MEHVDEGGGKEKAEYHKQARYETQPHSDTPVVENVTSTLREEADAVNTTKLLDGRDARLSGETR